MKQQWNDRFKSEEYVYGTEPNEFFKESISKIKPGRLLLLGEGEGRNGVYAAKNGWTVDAFDWSESAKIKALKLARANNCLIDYKVEDLVNIILHFNMYDAVGLIFLHLEEDLRESIHARVINTLKPGGKVILESYSKEQLNYSSGGPKSSELLYSLEDIVTDFNLLNYELLTKEKVILNEGELHKGEAMVIRMIGVK
ncbi:MAG: class I SAM-dependent methyltransferase [Ignavibacteriaceae bacterium]|nr:class I SAM-dependent methyltransferase [Ignavibacteriaceae bacterium]